MFNFFTRRTAQDYINEAKENYTVTESKPIVNEYYRVGVTDTGSTTLTLIGENGLSMTLTMTQYSCEQLIRMLRSTYDPEEIVEDANG
jgi:hypothetical protein